MIYLVIFETKDPSKEVISAHSSMEKAINGLKKAVSDYVSSTDLQNYIRYFSDGKIANIVTIGKTAWWHIEEMPLD